MATVLVVDDEADLRVLITTMLRMAGHEVVEAEGGEAALAAMAAMKVDVVLLDLMMPAMDGWSFLQSCRGNTGSAHIPIGLLSAAPVLLKTADAWGVQVAIGKPFALETLIEQVERLVDPVCL